MYRVLLVEDEEIELETLRDYIDWKKNGISRVFTARNGRRALECLEENMADIVITDIQMPGMSGIELAETIVRRTGGKFGINCPPLSYLKSSPKSNLNCPTQKTLKELQNQFIILH